MYVSNHLNINEKWNWIRFLDLKNCYTHTLDKIYGKNAFRTEERVFVWIMYDSNNLHFMEIRCEKLTERKRVEKQKKKIKLILFIFHIETIFPEGANS